jgi:hypothetical protein
MNQNEIPVYAKDLMAILNFKHMNSLRLAIKRGAVPPPDIQLSRKTRFWYKSTLLNAGLLERAGASANLPNHLKAVSAVANT